MENIDFSNLTLVLLVFGAACLVVGIHQWEEKRDKEKIGENNKKIDIGAWQGMKFGFGLGIGLFFAGIVIFTASTFLFGVTLAGFISLLR